VLLARYIAVHFCLAAGMVLLVLLVLFGFISLTDALEDVGKGSFTSVDAVAIVLLTTPARIVDLLPVTALLGALLGLGILANHQELTAIRAAGFSTWRIARTLLGIAAVLLVSVALLQFLLIPACEREAQTFRSRTLEQTARGDAEFWSRHDRRIIRVGSVEFGRIPRGIELYELDADARLLRFVRADRADVINTREWLLHDVEEKVIDGDQVYSREVPTLSWASFLSPEQISTLIAPPHALSPLDLYRYLRQSRNSGIDNREHEARFWHQVSVPFTLIGMLLLGLPLAAMSVRTRSTGLRSVLGAAVGIGFFLFERITGQLSLLFDIAPAVSALVPAVMVLGFALFAVWRLATRA
jgi:lipopolysaccharide export system permease protein